MKILSVASTTWDNLKRLVVKAWNGKSDTRTAIQAAPHGIDSNPTKGMVAIYVKTELDGNEYIIGYLNKESLAEPGETRIFSTDANGTLKAYSWHKTDGTIQFNGNADNLVRYAALNTQLQNEVTAINVELAKISAALNAIIPNIYVMQAITLNISSSKINDLKST